MYLTIIDEISMVGQKLLGLAEIITRDIRKDNRPWGGIHICFTGDWLQLPPVKARRVFEKPDDARKCDHTIAAYNLWKAINFYVMLQANMRQKNDFEFAATLRRLHWGVLTAEDIVLLNNAADITGHIRNDLPSDLPAEDNLAPFCSALNEDRCEYNRQSILNHCRKTNDVLFEIEAKPSKPRHEELLRRLHFMDDDCTDKVPLLLQFYMGMPVMITKRIKELAVLKLISNGTLGFIIGFISHDGNKQVEDRNFTTTLQSGIVVKRFLKIPRFLIVKIRGCTRNLVQGYPSGVVLIPPVHGPIKVTLPHNKTLWNPTVTQFPFICANALTPEKLQGTTLDYNIYISPLDRYGFSEASLYVAMSRVRKRERLVFTEPITRDYVNKFRPPVRVLKEMKSMLEKSNRPPYMNIQQSLNYTTWMDQEIAYCDESLLLWHNVTI